EGEARHRQGEERRISETCASPVPMPRLPKPQAEDNAKDRTTSVLDWSPDGEHKDLVPAEPVNANLAVVAFAPISSALSPRCYAPASRAHDQAELGPSRVALCTYDSSARM